jgi:hypothetical protein
MAEPQSYKNHTRMDPPFHFFLMPMLLLNLGFAIYATIHSWPFLAHRDLWWVVMSVVLFFMLAKSRLYALQNQDRIIRLEEKLRLAAVVSPEQLAELDSLTVKQYVALRFASNPELPELARRAVRERLTPKQIKEAIVAWRADLERV